MSAAKLWVIPALFVVMMAGGPALAQGGGGGGQGGGGQGGGGQGGGMGGQGSGGAMNMPMGMRATDQDRLKDQDRLRTDQVLRDQISNWSLLTSEERSRFHQEMQQAPTDAERTRLRTEHRKIITERARELGVDAPFGPGAGAGPAQNRYLMSLLLTDQERLQFHERMRAAGNDAERDRIRNEHRDMVQARAREMGVDLPAGF